MIDNNSLKIMNELCHDGRFTNVELARKLGISEVTVAKKINAMIENGIMEIKAMPNPYLVGYHSHAFIGLSVDLKKIDSVCNRLIKNIHVHMVSTSFGRFDIILFVFFHELEILQEFVKGELPQIEGINHVKTYFISEDKKGNERIFPEVLTEIKPALVDELNQKIIAELIRNGRPNYTELGSKLGVSKSTVSRRIALLLKESVIKILAIPNLSKLGYSANAYVLLNAEYSKINNICEQLFSYPEVHLIMRLMNEFDILFGVYSVNPHTLYDFLKNKIGNIDGIQKTETFIRGDYSYFSADAFLSSSI